MLSFRLDPYLWVHLAGLAAVPIWLDLCLLGLAAGNPVLPISVEVVLLALLGSLPMIWMQWRKPFCIYSLVFLALKPTVLDKTQLRTLRLFRDPMGRVIALAAPIPLIIALWKLYDIAPLASQLTPFPNRLVGFGVAAISFLLANLFLQVPASVIKVLLASDQAFARAKPYPTEHVGRDFSLLGLPVNRILPPLTLPAPSPVAPAHSPIAYESLWDESKDGLDVSEAVASANSSVQEPLSETESAALIEQPVETSDSGPVSDIGLSEASEEVGAAEISGVEATERLDETSLADAKPVSDIGSSDHTSIQDSDSIDSSLEELSLSNTEPLETLERLKEPSLSNAEPLELSEELCSSETESAERLEEPPSSDVEQAGFAEKTSLSETGPAELTEETSISDVTDIEMSRPLEGRVVLDAEHLKSPEDLLQDSGKAEVETSKTLRVDESLAKAAEPLRVDREAVDSIDSAPNAVVPSHVEDGRDDAAASYEVNGNEANDDKPSQGTAIGDRSDPSDNEFTSKFDSDKF